MKNDKLFDVYSMFIGALIGFFIGVALSLTATRYSAKHSQGFGLDYANIVLNNPTTVIDTIQTIRNQDTVITYEFKKQLK